MSFVVAYALAGAGTLLVVLWVMLYLRYSSQYDVMIAAIDKKQFFLPEIFFIGFGFMDMFKVNLKTEAGRKKEKKIAEIYGEKYAEYYGEAIAVPDKAGEKDAYLALIQTYKDNDSRFSVEEANQLTKYIKSNKAALQADPANYTEICFETGKLYWYYYDYGDGTDNQVTRAKSAVEWFQDVLDNAPEGYANLNMARVYVNIGSFYRDITTDITEASDKGKYKPFFDNIRELLDTVAADENESEIVRLELLELSRSALQQYATKFKGDGISQADMMQMYDQVERTVTGISATADTTEHKKEATVSLLADTKKAIETAYATKGGEQA